MHKFWSSTCLKLILMSMLWFTFWMFLKFSSPSTFSGFPFGFWCFWRIQLFEFSLIHGTYFTHRVVVLLEEPHQPVVVASKRLRNNEQQEEKHL